MKRKNQNTAEIHQLQRMSKRKRKRELQKQLENK